MKRAISIFALTLLLPVLSWAPPFALWFQQDSITRNPDGTATGKLVHGAAFDVAQKASVAFTLWDKESSITFGDSQSANSTLDASGRLKWTDSDREIQVYAIAPSDGAEFGGVEYEIHFSARPASNQISLPFTTSPNLDFVKQPILTPLEISRGNARPDNVINSYAVYRSDKGPLHGIPGDADKYRVGKAYHIYRPKAIDARGVEEWGDQDIDTQSGTWTLTFSRAWLDAATYPIIIDPTIGYTTLGGSVDGTGQFANANLWACATSGTTAAATAFYGSTLNLGDSVYVAVYDEGDGDISGNTRLAFSSAIALGNATAFYSAAITPPAFNSGTNYFIEGFSNTVGVFTMYDVGSTDQYTATTAATPPNPHDARGGTQSEKMSVYIDYTASGAATCPRTLLLLGAGC